MHTGHKPLNFKGFNSGMFFAEKLLFEIILILIRADMC